MKILALVLCIVGLAACAPTGGQPAFSVTAIPAATSMPIPAGTHTVARLPWRIASFDVSPDRQSIALATSNGALVYDLASYKLMRRLETGEQVGWVAWSPDGTRLAIGSAKDYGKPFFTGGDSGNSAKAHLAVWDTASWKIVFEPQWGDEMVNQNFNALAWSPDGLSIAFSPDLGGVQVLDIQSGKVVSRQTDFAAGVTQIAWSPDGSRLVANNDMAYGIRRWRLNDNVSVRLFDRRVGSSMALAWSPDGARIASGHTDGGVCLWTVATNRCDGFIHAHRSVTFSLAWSPDGLQLATGGGVIRIWDASTGKLIRAFGEQDNILYAQLRWPVRGGPLVSLVEGISGDSSTTVRIWDPLSGAILADFTATGQ